MLCSPQFTNTRCEMEVRIQELRSKIKKLEKKDKSHNEKSNNGVELVEYKS